MFGAIVKNSGMNSSHVLAVRTIELAGNVAKGACAMLLWDIDSTVPSVEFVNHTFATRHSSIELPLVASETLSSMSFGTSIVQGRTQS
jgi:hypothetical protein